VYTNSGFYEDAVKLMNPKYIIFSNSKENDDDHGASDAYSNASPDSTIYGTWNNGTLKAECDFDGEIEFYKM
jgi:hypothetical protein